MTAWPVLRKAAMRRLVLAAAAAVSFAGLAAAEDLYPYELKEKKPAAFAAWQELVPVAQHKAKWLYELETTATPIVEETMDGEPYLGGWACKPHDCGGNEFTFLIAEDGSRALARVTIADAKPVLWGQPSAEEQALLVKLSGN